MKRLTRRPKRLVVVLAALVLVVGVAGGWLLLRDDEPAAATSTTATVATETFRETVTASGTIAPETTADLAFGVSGTVTAVYVEPGDVVKEGRKLAQVGATVLQAELEAARSALAAARETQAEHLADGSSSEQTAADEAAVVAAESSLDEARQARADAVLRAPADGTVTSVGIEVGDVVGSSGGASGSVGAGGTSGTMSSTTASASTSSTITIVSTGRFVVDATVGAADIEKVASGLQAELTVSGVEDTVYGTVEEVGLLAETDSSGAAVFPVTIEVTGERDDVHAGTSADIAVIVSQRTDVLSVNSRAVRSDGATTYVEKVGDDGTTTRTEIEIGATNAMSTEVVSGLVEGDVVQVPGFSGTGGGGSDEMRERMGQGGPPDFGQGGPPDMGGGGTPPGGAR